MNLLIVDDQKDVVNSLLRGIHWEALEIEKVFSAYSAKEAKDIIVGNTIDLLLSDIEMPEEDGLSLFRWVKEQSRETECIFLTSHADFSYAREAIQLGGFDYILQPARFEEIEKVIRKAIHKVKQKHKFFILEQQQDYLLNQQAQILDGVLEEIFYCDRSGLDVIIQNIRPMLKKQYQEEMFYPIDIQVLHWKANKEEWNEELVKYVLYNVLQELFQDGSWELLISNRSTYHYLVIFCFDRSHFSIKEFENKLIKMNHFFDEIMEFDIAIYTGGDLAQGQYELIHQVYKSMNNNIMQKAGVFSGENVKNSEDDIRELPMNQWSRQIDQGEEVLVKKEIISFLKKKDQEGRLSLLLMKGLHHNFTKAYYAVMEKRKLSANELFQDIYSYEEYMNAFKSYDGMIKAMECCFEYLHACEKHTDNIDVVEKVKQYIQDNISKNISRKEVASHVYLNEEYCSRLFKSKTGYSFRDWVIMEKMNYGKKLLASTNFSVSIIASKIGYDNYSYFSKVFRKQEDMSPQEYRQMHKKLREVTN